MQNWSKIISLLVASYVLYACQEEETQTEEHFLSTSEETSLKVFSDSELLALDTLTPQLDIVYIDSMNCQNFLNKDGSYEVNWNILSDVKIENTYFPKYGINGYLADFGKSPLFLENKEMTIEGYVIPFLVDSVNFNYTYVVSKYPNSACFFCGGGGGPETVIELALKPNHRHYRVDEYLMVKGILQLNNDDPTKVNYFLKDAEIIE